MSYENQGKQRALHQLQRGRLHLSRRVRGYRRNESRRQGATRPRG